METVNTFEVPADAAGTVLAAVAVVDASERLAEAATLVKGWSIAGHSQRAIADAVNVHAHGSPMSPTTVGRLIGLHAVAEAHGVAGLADIWTRTARASRPVQALADAASAASMADAVAALASVARPVSVALPGPTPDVPWHGPGSDDPGSESGGPSDGSGVAGGLSDAAGGGTAGPSDATGGPEPKGGAKVTPWSDADTGAALRRAGARLVKDASRANGDAPIDAAQLAAWSARVTAWGRATLWSDILTTDSVLLREARKSEEAAAKVARAREAAANRLARAESQAAKAREALAATA